jgi:GAF domain-containing protein
MTNSHAPAQAFDLLTWRDRFIRVILRIASALGIALIAIAFPTATLHDRVLFISLYLILLVITLLPIPYGLRAYLLLSMVAAVGVNALLSWGPWADGSLFLLTAVFLAALLLDNKTDIGILAFFILVMLAVAYLIQTGGLRLSAPGAPQTTPSDWAVYLADFSISGAVVVGAANMLKNAFSGVVTQMTEAYQTLDLARHNLEEKVQERTAQLETRMAQMRASATTARAIAETGEISSLLNKAAALISGQFNFYHVGIYVLDELKRNAYLQAASSDAGKPLIGQSFRIEQERRNPLANVVHGNRTYIAHDLDKALFIHDPNFPLTHSRMVMPLSVRGAMIGLLDIHSDQPGAITSQDAEALQTLADLTAISFDNARLLDETRNLLSQLEAGATLQTGKTWSKFTSRQKNAYQYTPAGVRPLFSRSKKPDTDGALHLPILLHGKEIGRIRLTKRKSELTAWTGRERDLVEKISTQVALALENNRLVDEAQRNALRNQMIASFSTQVRETLDVESVVRTAAAEFRKVFDLKEAEILIGTGKTETDIPNQDSPWQKR